MGLGVVGIIVGTIAGALQCGRFIVVVAVGILVVEGVIGFMVGSYQLCGGCSQVGNLFTLLLYLRSSSSFS